MLRLLELVCAESNNEMTAPPFSSSTLLSLAVQLRFVKTAFDRREKRRQEIERKNTFSTFTPREEKGVTLVVSQATRTNLFWMQHPRLPENSLLRLVQKRLLREVRTRRMKSQMNAMGAGCC